jgi:hypothetical protein
VTITGFTDCVFTGTDDVQTIKELYPGKTATLKKDGFPDTGAHTFPAISGIDQLCVLAVLVYGSRPRPHRIG